MGFIYRITNTENKKVYIGQTIVDDPFQRWKGHLKAIKYGRACPVLRNAIKHYGAEKFKFEVIIICFDEDLNKFEKEYIKKFNCIVPNGYNVHEGGEMGGMFKGHHHTKETKKILSEKSRNRFEDIEVRKQHSKLIIEAQKKSDKWKLAIAEKRLGPKKGSISAQHSEEHCKKISESIKKSFANEIIYANHCKKMTEINGRPINQYTMDGTFINKYVSIKEAGKQTGINRIAIQACAAGRSKSSGGFLWKYAEKKEV
jgi:group I intron endonuclease